ncbi:MAG TPA: metallopeptidase family protein [Candidatus Limnocylindrales bacterium]|jgi:predicted Zn-dependent protease with MMP-like domain
MAKRARGSARRRQATEGFGRFEELVQRALDAIPQPFARALDEVAIVIQEEPSPQQLRESGLGPGEGLYGLYEGIPRTEYAADWAFLPNKITLFSNALLEDYPDPAELEHEVWITVIHELAHHLGIPEARLHDLGVG